MDFNQLVLTHSLKDTQQREFVTPRNAKLVFLLQLLRVLLASLRRVSLYLAGLAEDSSAPASASPVPWATVSCLLASSAFPCTVEGGLVLDT